MGRKGQLQRKGEGESDRKQMRRDKDGEIKEEKRSVDRRDEMI